MKKVTEFPDTPGGRLKELRAERHLSQAELAEEIGLMQTSRTRTCSEKQIGYIERNERPMSSEYARLFSRFFGIRVQYLLCDDNYMTEHDKLCASLDRMEESARILHNVIRLAANSQGCEIEMLDITADNQPVPIESDSIYYVFKRDGLVTAHLSLSDYSRLRDEIYHYSYYLVEKYCNRQEKQLIEPYAMEPKQKGGRKNG